jgi:hypothetical protein
LALCLISGVTIFSYGSLMGKPWSGNGFNPMLIVAIANSCSLVVLAWVYSRLGLGFTHLPFSEDVLHQSTQPNPEGESVAEPLDSALQPERQHECGVRKRRALL